jgi:hypothetical protein
MQVITQSFSGGKNNIAVIFTHSRATLLEESIVSFLEAIGSESWSLLIVQQAGSLEINQILKKYEQKITLLMRFNDIGKGVLGNINYSRLLGTSIAFDQFSAELVLGIEEDTKISKDSLVFIEQMQLRYGFNSRFRGVNLCSRLPLNPDLMNTYSILRFGLSGQAGAINLKTWQRINLHNLLKDIGEEEWASRIEPIMKTGFVIHPNNSRLFDQGWGGYSSAELGPDSESFVTQHASWVGDYLPTEKSYVRQDMPGVWRHDAIFYRPWHNIYFDLRPKKAARFFYKFWKFIRLPKIEPERH